MVNSEFLLIIAAVIFFIGMMGLFLRNNLLVILMCIELMLNAVNLTFVVFSYMRSDLQGQISVFFTVIIAAAESAVGLGLVIALFRTLRTTGSEKLERLRG